MKKFNSQHGEDAILAQIFQGQVGTCVEVGANDGTTFSNSLYFEKAGWTCVLVEPTPHLCEIIRETRNSIVFECAASSMTGETTLHFAEGMNLYSSVEERSTMAAAIDSTKVRQVLVQLRPLDDLLREAKVNKVDFVTIDVEGHELEVLKGLTLTEWRPRILIVEDGSDLCDTPVVEHLRREGYRRFYRSGGNDWYASQGDRELASLRKLIFSHLWRTPGLLKAWLPPAIRRPLLLLSRKVFVK